MADPRSCLYVADGRDQFLPEDVLPLARQFGQWQKVVDLYGEAKGLSPNRGVELLPFIEGMLRTERRDLAEPLAAAVRAQYGTLAKLEATPKDPAAR